MRNRASSVVTGFVLAAACVAHAAHAAPPTRTDGMRTFTRLPTDVAGRVTWRSTAVPVRAASATPGAAPAATTFDALARSGARWPGDPTGAAGRRWILTAANASFALYDRTGAAVVGPAPLATLFGLASRVEVRDPRIVFDQYRARFVLALAAIDRARDRSWILLVSIPDATATDAGTWCGVRVAGDRTRGDARQFVSGTGLGYDRDHVAVSANTYTFASERFAGATVLSFPKRTLYDCSRSVAFDTFTGSDVRTPGGGRAAWLQPAQTVGDGDALYLTSFSAGVRDAVVLWRLRGSGAASRLERVRIRVPHVAPASRATQGGGTIDDPDTWWDPGPLRLTTAFADATRGRLYTAQTVAENLEPDPSGSPYIESAIRWYEIRLPARLGGATVSRTGTIGQAQTDAGWPAVATDAAGDVFVTYARASALTGEYLSAWIAEIDRGSSVAANLELRAGTARLETTPGPEPWGEQTAISRDPTDGDVVVAVNQVAVSDGSSTTQDWREVVSMISGAA